MSHSHHQVDEAYTPTPSERSSISRKPQRNEYVRPAEPIRDGDDLHVAFWGIPRHVMQHYFDERR
ncbi:MAG: hypothetical protein D6775_09870 [Caldilineae bacterium]|nr:MAG: hypothetical protein D6775_09870 [Caldilineae bacterium]